MAAVIAILLVAALYVLLIRGRTGHKALQQLRTWRYAHRGLHGQGVPENSMAAFRRALEKGYGIELDLHLMRDGQLAVIHDASLKRTAGADVQIEDLTAAQLAHYRLENTDEPIPLFSQVLSLFDGKAPLIVELKAERNNHAALCRAACDALEGYNGPYCIESFDPRCINWLKKHRPQVIRGQLAENFLRSKSGKLSPVLRFALTNLMLNCWTGPDFVAYNFRDKGHIAPKISQKLWGVQAVSWTLRTPQELQTAEQLDMIPIFEGFEP